MDCRAVSKLPSLFIVINSKTFIRRHYPTPAFGFRARPITNLQVENYRHLQGHAEATPSGTMYYVRDLRCLYESRYPSTIETIQITSYNLNQTTFVSRTRTKAPNAAMLLLGTFNDAYDL